MSRVGLIGGSGLSSFEEFDEQHRENINTSYGSPSAELVHGVFHGNDIVFLARHGSDYSLPPHRINYRANIWAMHTLEVDFVVTVNTVGGIRSDLSPGVVAVPDQIVDYTYGREQTFFDGENTAIEFLDFTSPYTESVRQRLLSAAGAAKVTVVDGGTYGATQGPRLETKAEVLRLKNDGCDMIGMTGMPETVLARELGMGIATLAVVVNWCAGLGEGGIHDQVEANTKTGLSQVIRLLAAL